MPTTRQDDRQTALIVNPKSGTGDHLEHVSNRAELAGYALETTEREGHGVELTRAAIDGGADEVVAVGGDGTLNEVIRGVRAADALDDVTVGVVPAGTGNDFAQNVGIPDIETGFEVLQHGERRDLDLGLADDRPFVNSCIAGLTAESSARTSPELKSRFGVLAYVGTTMREAAEFDGLELTATVGHEGADEEVWSGSATIVLIGNGRRFSLTGGEQANLEDGLLDVTILEDASTIDQVGERALRRLLGEDEDGVTRLLVSSVELAVEDRGSANFSLDGEMESFTAVTLSTDPGALTMPVGDGYEPIPDGE